MIFNGDQKALSINISNQNKELPYLAQSWIEDEHGSKTESSLTILPPVQRVEPGAKSQVKIQTLAGANLLPQDRETLFYFNLREIPPRSDKANVLQLALQTRVKLFYRPASIIPKQSDVASTWQNDLTLTQKGNDYQVTNPSPYYVTLVDASSKKDGASAPGFEPLMVAPKGSTPLKVAASALGNTPVLTYVNDYGGRPQLSFNCNGASCQAVAGSK